MLELTQEASFISHCVLKLILAQAGIQPNLRGDHRGAPACTRCGPGTRVTLRVQIRAGSHSCYFSLMTTLRVLVHPPIRRPSL